MKDTGIDYNDMVSKLAHDLFMDTNMISNRPYDDGLKKIKEFAHYNKQQGRQQTIKEVEGIVDEMIKEESSDGFLEIRE